MNKLQIRCQGADIASLDDLHEFQGELKSLAAEDFEKLKKELIETGFAFPFNVWLDPEGKKWIVDGHQRKRTLGKLRESGMEIPELPVNWVHASNYEEAKRRVLQGTSQYGRIEKQGLYEFITDAKIPMIDLESSFALPGISMLDFKLEYFKDPELSGSSGSAGGVTTLAERFLVPPFSVLDARQGYWQDRKRAWLSIGIESEKGRGENLLQMSDTMLEPDPEKREAMRANRAAVNKHSSFVDQDKLRAFQNNRLVPGGHSGLESSAYQKEMGAGKSGTSIFDPVLCELVYRWFSPKGGVVLDPFAGGSVRGVVASKTGRQYYGCELREEQVAANREQGLKICSELMPAWQCGDSQFIDQHFAGLQADLIFSCPPYADLEVYSEDPRDISNMPYDKFLETYRSIISRSCAMLSENSFAAFVVGDIRDKNGNYRNFVSDTIQAFLDAGLSLYNEAILVTAVGTLPIRAGRMFSVSRKLGKTHQQLLVFLKGNAKAATEKCGIVELSDEMFDALEPSSEEEISE